MHLASYHEPQRSVMGSGGIERLASASGGGIEVRNAGPGFPYNLDFDGSNTMPWSIGQRLAVLDNSFMRKQGTVVMSVSTDGGRSWFFGDSPAMMYRVHWRVGTAGGEVRARMAPRRQHVPPYACHSGSTSITMREGDAQAYANVTIVNGEVSTVVPSWWDEGFADGNGRTLTVEWPEQQGEPQTGSGATFSFDVAGGNFIGAVPTNKGSGYTVDCWGGQAASVYDTRGPGYQAVSAMRAALVAEGGTDIQMRIVISTPRDDTQPTAGPPSQAAPDPAPATLQVPTVTARHTGTNYCYQITFQTNAERIEMRTRTRQNGRTFDWQVTEQPAANGAATCLNGGNQSQAADYQARAVAGDRRSAWSEITTVSVLTTPPRNAK